MSDFNFFDFNSADEQGGELIPTKTLCKVIMKINPGGRGESGWSTVSNSGFEYLKTEITIISEPYAKRKIFQNIGIGGTTDGHKKAAQISRKLLRAVLESARNIYPKDESNQAREKRQVSSFNDFNELEFATEVGIEKDKNGVYPDKNKINKVITPDHSKYQQIMSGETIVPEGVKNKQKQSQNTSWTESQPQKQQEQQKQQEEQSKSAIPKWAQ